MYTDTKTIKTLIIVKPMYFSLYSEFKTALPNKPNDVYFTLNIGIIKLFFLLNSNNSNFSCRTRADEGVEIQH